MKRTPMEMSCWRGKLWLLCRRKNVPDGIRDFLLNTPSWKFPNTMLPYYLKRERKARIRRWLTER